MENKLALDTIKYIWTHPSNRNQKTFSVCKFAGWQAYKRITDKYIDLRLTPGIKIRCYPDSRSSSAALYCGLYDYNEMNFLLRYLRPEDSFVDIGANIGIYTLLAASVIKSGSIYSFEALPKNYVRLQENLKLNKICNATPFSIAVSDRKGEVALNIAEGDSMPFITSSADHHTISVPTNSLDNLLQDLDKDKLTLCKMDIEGAEILAFQGARKLLHQKCPAVWILEINNAVENFGHQKEDVVSLLSDYGYHLYSYNADVNRLDPITLNMQKGNNVLAIAESTFDFVIDRIKANN